MDMKINPQSDEDSQKQNSITKEQQVDPTDTEASKKIFNKKNLIKNFLKNNKVEIDVFSAISSVLLTFGLVIFAGWSSWESNRIRNLQFKQYVVSNLPSVRQYVDNANINLEEGYLNLSWKAKNSGGPVENLLRKTIVLATGYFSDKYEFKIFKTSSISSVLDKDEAASTHVKSKFDKSQDEFNSFLKKLKGFDKRSIYLILRTTYDVPDELSLDGKSHSKTITDIFVWAEDYGKFADVNVDTKNKIENFVLDKNLFDFPDNNYIER